MSWQWATAVLLQSLCLLAASSEAGRLRLLPRFWLRAQSTAYSYRYDTKYITQKVDHFSAGDEPVFQQRYLVNTEHWKTGDPILFYTGNEGDITLFCNNTGFVWDLAPELGAMVVFAEHRYYGTSLPFGNASFSDLSRLKYLTSEQALADFAELITYLKECEYKTDSAVIAVGGSYGGMLTAWLRMKYPNVVQGGLAASAPIWLFTGLTPCNSFYATVTRDFHDANPNCSANIRASWPAIDRVAQQAEGMSLLSTVFRLCGPLKDTSTLKVWLESTWSFMAMVDYPYPANFLEPLPAWPINKACEHLATTFASDKELLQAVSGAALVYYNSTGSVSCLNTSSDATSNLGELGWNFQACTEMVMPLCTDGVNDMFFPQPWNIEAYSATCKAQFGVTPDPYWVETLYGGKNISSHSNIIFSNGLLDPWSGGGVLESLSDSLVALVLPIGAHHLDLRAATPNDPPALTAMRQQERALIVEWIQQYN